MFNKIIKFIFPITIVVLQLLYIFYILYLCVNDLIKNDNWVYYSFLPLPDVKNLLYFLPVLILELISTFYVEKYYKKIVNKLNYKKILISFIKNILVWVFVYIVLVILPWNASLNIPWVKWFSSSALLFIVLIIKTQIFITSTILLISIYLYYKFTYKKGYLKFTTILIIPGLVPVFILIFYWHKGGVFNLKSIENQKGIYKIYDINELNYFIENKKIKKENILELQGNEVRSKDINVKNHPRGICVDPDENFFIIFYGCTYCFSPQNMIVVVKKDLISEDLSIIIGDVKQNIRKVDCNQNNKNLFVAPWEDVYIYEIEKNSFFIKNTFYHQTYKFLNIWEPVDILYDNINKKIIVANNQIPAIISYHYNKNLKLNNYINLYKQGYIGMGGTAWYLVKSKGKNRLYFIGCPGEGDLYELDLERMKILRSIKIEYNNSCGAGLVIDDEEMKLYYQSGFYNNLYKIDIKSFSIEKKYEGQYFSRRLILDKKRNSIYVLSYLTGKLISINLNTGEKIWELNVGGRPHGMKKINNNLWVHSMSGVFLIKLNEILL